MKRVGRQLELPLALIGERGVRDALVEVVLDGRKTTRPRVRAVGLEGWVRFPRSLRLVGVFYAVEELTPLPGGAWAARGKIRRLPAPR